MKITAALFVATLLSATVGAWSINGHLFVANIAQDLMLQNSPTSLIKALEMLTYLKDYNETLTVGEGDYPYVESATFADDIKYHGGAWQSDFHFVTNPFIAEGQASDYEISTAKHNLTFGVEAIVQWLSLRDDGEDYLNSYAYNYIQNSLFPGNENVAKSYAFRLLIHYVGDIHQPFHTEAMYSSLFPTGDKGGNLITLPSHYSVDELHAVWDQQMYAEHNHISRPINQTAWDSFQPRVVALMASGASAVANPSEYQNIEIAGWIQQSYEISKTLYEGVVIDTELSQDYIDKGIVICNERITLGGYRLAYLTEYIFATAAEQELFLQ